jgi:hypothetical protein|tara:strand:+ start:486 stop:749 length:264 start_codon:yes stop_codon:yes gene_type:complete
MNAKKVKQLRKKIKPLQLEWLQSLLSDKEFKKISMRNIEEFLPKDIYVVAGYQIYLAFMSDKWVMKKLKRNPNIISYKELQQTQENC